MAQLVGRGTAVAAAHTASRRRRALLARQAYSAGLQGKETRERLKMKMEEQIGLKARVFRLAKETARYEVKKEEMKV